MTLSVSTLPIPIIFAIAYENGKFGASLFINNEFKILPQDESDLNRDLIDWVSLQDGEIKFISSSKSNLSSLKQCIPSNAVLQLLPSNEFRLLQISELLEEFNLDLEIEDNLQPSSTNELSFMCLHALISYITKCFPALEKPRQVSPIRIETTNVTISKSCLNALQIFNYEPHPNMHASNQGIKEGISVFSLFDHTVSEEGRSKLKKWFHNPTNDTKILKSRLDSIEVLIKPEMNNFVKSVTKSLKKCIKITNIVNELKFRPNAMELLKIGRFCESLNEIYWQSMDSSVIEFPIIKKLKSLDHNAVRNLGQIINRIIDKEGSSTSEIYTVKEYVSSELDELRLKYNNLPDFLTNVVSEVASGINSTQIEAVNIVYFPQLGFLITLPLPFNGLDATCLGNELGFELQFQSEKICYYKNEKMRGLDRDIGDVYADIIDVQLEIMQKIVDEAVNCEETLILALEICSEIDCLIAMSTTSQSYSLNKPEISTDSSELIIEDGRHLLVELCTNRECIANNCNLQGTQTKTIITGANSSGKSVYLKQVGIITYLAHIGSYVPARFARIGLIDRIVTRIKTVEQTGNGESCFMIDLKQVKSICDTFTERSLILIDEFGKGTAQNDGLALFSGLLLFFASKNVRLIAITHMYEIFRQHSIFKKNQHQFQLAHMKVLSEKSSGLCYLYRLEEGLGNEQSFAIECAQESGIPESTINKAKLYLTELRNGASPEDLKLLQNESEKLDEAINLINSIVIQT